MEIATIGIDLAKTVFQVHGVDRHGKLIVRKQLRPRTKSLRPSQTCRPVWLAWRPAAVRITGRESTWPPAESGEWQLQPAVRPLNYDQVAVR